MGCPKLEYNLSAEPSLRCVYNAADGEEECAVHLAKLKTVKGATVVRDMDFVFDPAKGNLTSRKGMFYDGVTAQTETFGYDNLDRLMTMHRGNSPPGTLEMEINYQDNGNIQTKTGLGVYSYSVDAGPHALTVVDNAEGLINSHGQTIEYNAFNKAYNLKDTIVENGVTKACELDIIYGPGGQRWKTVLNKSSSLGVNTKTTLFAGDYERITEGGIIKELIYLPGGGIHVKQGGKSEIYYAHKDHLGSIMKLTTAADTAAVFRARYDAWGKQTVLKNTINFHRGYTGHEHLPEFGLINMNGRMYDPIVGRFLSPDPFVQMPDFSQSFNRYSYCLNNPLSYTDPSGEKWWKWLLGAAFIIDPISTFTAGISTIAGAVTTVDASFGGVPSATYFMTFPFSNQGYEVQKYISPIAIKPDFQFNSETRGIGIDVSVGIPKITAASYRWDWGATYYSKFYDTGWSGWETRKGQEWGIGGYYSASFTEHTMHGMKDFNQTVFRLMFGGPIINAMYYNDHIDEETFGIFRDVTPNSILKRDTKEDRWRTNSARVNFGPLQFGLDIITGDPGPDGYRRTYTVDGQEYYESWGDYNPSKYSHGIFYGGIGPFKIGRNSEGIRDYFQNQFAHKPRGIPFFPKLPRPGRWFWSLW